MDLRVPLIARLIRGTLSKYDWIKFILNLGLAHNFLLGESIKWSSRGQSMTSRFTTPIIQQFPGIPYSII